MHSFEILTESGIWTQTPGVVPIYTEDGFSVKNPAVGYPHQMYSSVCSENSAGLLGTACLWAHGDIHSNITVLDNEYSDAIMRIFFAKFTFFRISIAVTDLQDFIATVKDIAKKTPTTFPVLGIIMRFSAKSDIYMSTSYQRDTVHVEFAVAKRTDAYNDASGSLAGYQTILQALVLERSNSLLANN